jgi:hypothetical protein
MAGEDRDSQIAAAVDAVFARADRDSSAAQKHWMRQRLERALDGTDEAGGHVVSVAFPTAPVAGAILPVTATVLGLDMESDSMEDAMKALAAVAAADPTAKPMPTPAGLALRTHRVADVKEAFDAEVAEAPVSREEREEISAASSSLPMLRARYLVPASGDKRWHAVAFSATLGTEEPELVDTFLELFDAFAETLEWRPEQ